jgi:hypothetical protein
MPKNTNREDIPNKSVKNRNPIYSHPSYSDPQYKEYKKYADRWTEEKMKNVTEEDIKDYFERNFDDPTSLLGFFTEDRQEITLEANLIKNNLKTIIENLNKEEDYCHSLECDSIKESVKSEVTERVK